MAAVAPDAAAPTAKRQVRVSTAGRSRNRLPTLQEVLARKTRPPVDLYCFYLYLQRERAEDALDFWLDAQQHENLCRAYFKDLRRSHISLNEEWPAYYDRARTRGSVFNTVNGITRTSPDADPEKSPIETSHEGNSRTHSAASHMPRPSQSTSRNNDQRTPSPNTQPGRLPPHLSPGARALFAGEEAARDQDGKPKTGRQSASAQPVIPRSSAITRTDLIISAERIYYRYLVTGAEKEIYLPPVLRIHDFPLNSSQLPSVHSADYEEESRFLADIPDLFVAQKEYVYRSMEQDTFPRFLRAKAFGNLTPLSALIRLAFGLVALWAGLTTGLALIFLDTQPRAIRFWVILPFSIAIICIVAHFYDLDPVLMLFNLSETTPFRTLQIKERYVQKILRGRAVWVTFLSAMIVVALSAIFIAVPGHRI